MSITQLQSTLDSVRLRQPVAKNSAGSGQAAKSRYLRTSLDVKVNIQQPLKLVYQAALVHLNSALEPVLGSNAVPLTLDYCEEMTPRSTAEHIVSAAKKAYDTINTRQENLKGVLLGDFQQVASASITAGFTEARTILRGLQRFSGDVADNINQTYGFTQDGLAQLAATQK
jgi:hypothetical protein